MNGESQQVEIAGVEIGCDSETLEAGGVAGGEQSVLTWAVEGVAVVDGVH